MLTAAGLRPGDEITPRVGAIEPMLLQMALRAERFGEGGTLYRETMSQALALEIVRTLLRTTDLTVAEIARRVGYSARIAGPARGPRPHLRVIAAPRLMRPRDERRPTMTRFLLGTAIAAAAGPALAEPQTRPLSFTSEALEGTLYLPEGHDGAALPTVIVTGAWTSVEEQMPATYAREMAERGFAAVTFGFRGWCKSADLPDDIAGGPRFTESPAAKTSDIRAAFAFAATLPEVDAAALHGLGICARAGYMVDAASGNPAVARVGQGTPWLQNAEIVEAVYGAAEGVGGLVEVAREAEARGGEIILAAGPECAEGVPMPIGGYYRPRPGRGRGLRQSLEQRWLGRLAGLWAGRRSRPLGQAPVHRPFRERGDPRGRADVPFGLHRHRDGPFAGGRHAVRLLRRSGCRRAGGGDGGGAYRRGLPS